MKNMRPYDKEDAFNIYKKAVSRKSEGDDKTNLLLIETQIAQCYELYNQYYERNKLEYLSSHEVGVKYKKELQGLYGSKAKVVKDFRQVFFEINPRTYNNLCPYCLINSSNTTDHILPQEQYPEHAINVKNLIPACGECNSAKGENVLDAFGNKCTINFYVDILPEEQFLFVDIIDIGGQMTFNYKLENVSNKINTKLYALIERHFEKLNLLNRYKEKAIQEIAEIRNTYLVETFDNEEQYKLFTSKQRMKCDLDIREYGRNHWRVVLLRACADSEVFKNSVLK